MQTLRTRSGRFFLPFTERVQQAARAVPAAWKVGLGVFVAGRLFYSAWAAWIWWMGLMPHTQGYYYFDITPVLEGLPGALLGMWQRWDAIHYQRIMMYGYEEAGLTAFFPLYPLLARGLAWLTGMGPLPALITVSNLAFLFSLVILYQLVETSTPQGAAGKTLFNLLIYPCAFYFYAIYPQALLLFWILLAYWNARQGRWPLACLASLLAGLTHPTAAALSALLGIEALSALRKGDKGRLFILLAPVANLLAAAGYMLWQKLAGFGGYLGVQQAVYQRAIRWPWLAVEGGWRFIQQLPFDLDHSMEWVSVIMLVVIIVLLVGSLRKLPLSMSLYLVAFLLMMLVTFDDEKPLLGILRYPVVMFPMFIWLGTLRLPRAVELAKFLLFVLLSLVCSAAFLMWKGGVS